MSHQRCSGCNDWRTEYIDTLEGFKSIIVASKSIPMASKNMLMGWIDQKLQGMGSFEAVTEKAILRRTLDGLSIKLSDSKSVTPELKREITEALRPLLK